MNKPVKTTQTREMEYGEKWKKLNEKMVSLKLDTERIQVENDALIKFHTKLLDDISLLELTIKGKEIEANVLLNDMGIYLSDIADLKLIQEDTIKDIKEMYLGLEQKLSEVQQKLDSTKDIYKEIHQKCVKEQDTIQSQKRDLQIYKNRLQKKYDEIGFGKVILIEK